MKKTAGLLIICFFVSALHIRAQDRGLTVVAAENLGPQANIGRQYALFIAIDAYRQWNPLKKPVADAREIRDILKRDYFIDEVIELYNQQATRANIARAFTDLQSKLGVHDSLFIYYAGHGHFDENSNAGFWIPFDAGTDQLAQENWLPNSQIRGYISRFKAIHVFMVSDACFSGDILDTSRSMPPQIDNAFFRRAYTFTSRQVITSGASETVPDQSEFSAALINSLRKNTSPLLDPLGIYNDVRLSVRNTLPLYGTLNQSNHQDGATFLFFRRPSAEASAPEAVPDGFVRINGGAFTMGSPRTEARRDRDEVQRQVTVSSFYMSAKEVTLKEYLEVMQFNPNGLIQGANLPAININWYSAVEYCNARSIAEGLTPAYYIYYREDPNNQSKLDIDRFLVIWDKSANGYRLPTEAEWEYSCRAGTNTAYNTGDRITNSHAHFNGGGRGIDEGIAFPVGAFSPNRWGLYDMHGNAGEWCWDWYGEYDAKALVDPSGPSSGKWRVAKGGSYWNRKPEHLRSAHRLALTPTWYGGMGIRLVRSITAQQPQQFSTAANVNYSLTNAQRKASRTRWQIGAFSQEINAYRLKSRLENAGIDTSYFHVERIGIDGRSFYCAFVGENLNGTMRILLYQAGFPDAIRQNR